MVPNRPVPPVFGPLPDAFSYPLPGADSRPLPPEGSDYLPPPLRVSPAPEHMAGPEFVTPQVIIRFDGASSDNAVYPPAPAIRPAGTTAGLAR